VALIHYYKFNGNLYDSIGAFDLLADFGTPTYTTGKLGGSTGAVASDMMTMYILGCTGTGAAASGFLAADASEAAAGVSAWSMTGWVYCSGTTTQIINLLSSTSGQSSAYLYYDQKLGGLTFRGITKACSTGTWVFFTVRVTGGTCYLSVNGGTESTNSWATGSGTGGKTQFNGIRIGSPSLYIALYARVDDVRVFNHSLSSGEIAGIYNAGLPAEASSTALRWQYPANHYKCNNNTTDSIGTSTFNNPGAPAGTIAYNSGLCSASPYSLRVYDNLSDNTNLPTVWWNNSATSGWTSGNSYSISFWESDTTTYNASGYLMPTIGYGYHSSGYEFSLRKNSMGSSDIAIQGTTLVSTSGTSTGFFFLAYDSIAQRFIYRHSDGTTKEKASSGGVPSYFTVTPIIFTLPNTDSTIYTSVDDVRLFQNKLSGFDYEQIYNGGAGTEVSSSPNGTATGAGVAVTMAAPAGTAIAPSNASATGAGAVVTMTAPAGAAVVPTNGSATGAGATVTMAAPAGIAFIPVNASATGTGRTITMVAPAGTVATSWITEPIPTVTMVPPEGRVQIGAETIGPTILVTIPPAGLGAGGGSASGTGRTVTVSAPAGSATGGAASAGTIGTVTLSAAAGSATGSAPASGAPSTVAVTAPTGGATGTATKAGALASVTMTTTSGSAIGTAAAGGALATIAVGTTVGSAAGTAAATGAGRTVAVSAPAGTLTASATTAGALATITVAAPAATRTGGATASPAGATVTVAAPAGGSIGTATGTGAISTATMTAPGGAARVSVSAAGSLPAVAIAAAAGAATGTASTTGSGATVTMTAPAGVARASVVATGAPGTVTMTATAGSATGTLTAPLATITMVAPTGTALAIVRGIGALGTVTMTAPGAGTITASATGNPSGVTVSVIAPAARVAPITTGGGTSVSTYDLRRAGTNL
jgi:hypothetical protein